MKRGAGRRSRGVEKKPAVDKTRGQGKAREAGEDHQQVVERVPHAEKGHWLDIYDNHPYPLLHQFPFDHGKAPSTGFLGAVLIITILSIALDHSSTF